MQIQLCAVQQGSRLRPLFSVFTNDLPSTLNKACVSMYADDSVYIDIELQSVLERVASNGLKNISKTKSIISFDKSIA